MLNQSKMLDTAGMSKLASFPTSAELAIVKNLELPIFYLIA
jgi:hypothetical protein